MSDTGEHPVTKDELKHTLSVNDAKLVMMAIVVAVGTAFGAYRVVLNEARAQTDAGVEEVKGGQVRLDQRLEMHLRESGQAHQQMKADLHEVQMDIRALYRSMQDGKRSPRLERPLDPDAGK